MANITISEIVSYLDKGFNLLLEGPHGVGKTHMVRQAVENLGSDCAYFNGATMDPYLDLVGVPKTVVREDGTDELVLVRKRIIDTVEYIFIDEINRMSDPRGQDALLELVQSRSINGEKLPKLKAVVACVNPVKDAGTGTTYQVGALGPEMVDRFDIYERVTPEVTVSMLVQQGFTRPVAAAAARWFSANSGSGDNYLSPRCMVKMLTMYQEFPTVKTLTRAAPPFGRFSVGELHSILQPLVDTESTEKAKEKALAKASARIAKRPAAAAEFASKDHTDEVLRGVRVRTRAVEYLSAPDVPVAVKDQIARKYSRALRYNVGPELMIRNFGVFIEHMSVAERQTLARSWNTVKARQFSTALAKMDSSTPGVSALRAVLAA